MKRRFLICLTALIVIIMMANMATADTLDFDPIEPIEWAVTIGGKQSFDNAEELSEGVFYQMFLSNPVEGWRKFIPKETGTYSFYVRQTSTDYGGYYTAGRFSIIICDVKGRVCSGIYNIIRRYKSGKSVILLCRRLKNYAVIRAAVFIPFLHARSDIKPQITICGCGSRNNVIDHLVGKRRLVVPRDRFLRPCGSNLLSDYG